MDHLGSMVRREIEDCLDHRVPLVARVNLVALVLEVPSALLVLLVFPARQDLKGQRETLVQRVRREILVPLDPLGHPVRPETSSSLYPSSKPPGRTSVRQMIRRATRPWLTTA